MRYFEKPDRNQQILLTEINLNTIAPEGSVLRYIDELVEQLDVSEIKKHYDLESERGKNPIHPKTFLKVGLYALHNCRFSLRKMQEDIENHLGYKWLTGDRAIDHSTLGKFFSTYKIEIADLFIQIIMLCKEHNLVEFDLLSIDSVKIRANASYKNEKTLKGIEKEEEAIKEKLSALLNQNQEEREKAEEETLNNRLNKLEEMKKKLKERIEEKSQTKGQKEKEQIKIKEKINITDPDAKILQQANGEKNPAYLITVSADTENDIITNFKVNERDCGDADALIPVIKGSIDNIGKKHDTVNADAGFASKDNYENLEEMKQEALIPDKKFEVEKRGETKKEEFDKSNFNYNEVENTYECPLGKKLQQFSKNHIKGRIILKYHNEVVCSGCNKREQCCSGKARIIQRDQNEEVVERMREKLRKEENKQKYKKRLHTSESPFGQLKRNLKFTFFMRRGREKVRMEMSLLCMLHNILKLGPQLV